MEELLSADSQEKVDKLAKAQLQILILCPNFATKMADLKRDINSEELFKTDKILVMLLGVEKNQVITNHSEGKNILRLCLPFFLRRRTETSLDKIMLSHNFSSCLRSYLFLSAAQYFGNTKLP